MSAEEFRARVESGKVLVDSHDRVLRISFIYLDEGLWDGNGVFDVVDQLHARGWSFGQGELRLNRTLDIFYLTQIAAGIYRSSDQTEGDFPSADDFDAFYAQHRPLLGPHAWRQYYSPALLAQAISARFYRLPDLQDLPDSSGPLGQPRTRKKKGGAPTLPVAAMTQMALFTLQQTIARQRKEDHPTSVQPYSETQARFWLKYMGMDSPDDRLHSSSSNSSREAWNPNEFGIGVAQGAFDIWAWEACYSRERWENSTDAPPLEPDLDGTRPSEVRWCGWPDGAGAKETEGFHVADELDYAMRSHILLALLHAAMESETETEAGKQMEELRRRMVGAGRIDESRAEQWIRQAWMVMEPYLYVHKRDDDPSELLRQILVENGQLFARWKLSPSSPEFDFELKPRE
ncbi:hypothetical protein PG997_015411 [Apiospora hydei]|uniref:Uncharacterized protein n=1 Tax=Apiospora hydei TaxID=1337664 RepID=A0ABR1UT36_9PEZI